MLTQAETPKAPNTKSVKCHTKGYLISLATNTLPEALNGPLDRALHGALPKAMPEALPEALHEALHEALPEALPEALHEALPEAKLCRELYQSSA